MIEYITGAGQEGDTILEKFLLNVRTQLEAFDLLSVSDPSHFLGQLYIDFKSGAIPGIQSGHYVFVVRHQFVPLPYELELGSFPIAGRVTRSQFGSKIIVDASLLKKSNHGLHEANTIHIRKHSSQIKAVEIASSYRVFIFFNSYPLVLE